MGEAMEIIGHGPGAKWAGTWGKMLRALGLNGLGPEAKWAGPWG